jgi:hypothetical protein
VLAQLLGILRSLGKVLLVAVGVFVAIGLPFLLTAGFSFQAYSDRLLWAGILAILIGGMGGILGGLGATARKGFRRDGSSKPDSSEREAHGGYTEGKHYSFAFRFWALGLVCVAASALVGMLLG